MRTRTLIAAAAVAAAVGTGVPVALAGTTAPRSNRVCDGHYNVQNAGLWARAWFDGRTGAHAVDPAGFYTIPDRVQDRWEAAAYAAIRNACGYQSYRGATPSA